MRPPLLARREDLHCLVFHGACLAAYALAFWLWLHAEEVGIDSLGERAAFVAAAAFLLGWISGIDVGVVFHNHTHRRVFTRPWLNRWATRLWTVSGGWPGAYWTHAHVVVHHAELLEAGDWTVPRRRADGRFENLYVYLLSHWPWRCAASLWRDVRSGRFERRVATTELLWFALLWSLPFLLDPWMGVWLWLLPHWVANCVTMGSGMYVQHAGCVPRSDRHPTAHSNTFVNDFFNRTMFHIGYHVEHHDHAGVHWADLPAFHARHRASLVAAGAHVVTCGYYGAARRLSGVWRPEREYDVFAAEQAPGYERAHERTPLAVLLQEPVLVPARSQAGGANAADDRAASA